MSARVMFTVSRILPDDRAAVESDDLRFLLQRAGWEILAEACDPLEDPAAPPAVGVPTVSPAQLTSNGACPRCHGVGRAAGISSPCGTCKGTG